MGPASRNRSVALSLVAIILGMSMLTYASVPLYRLFCQVTGFGGTTQSGKALPETVSDRTITVRFNADTSPDLPWTFLPPEHPVKIKVGASELVSFTARNEGDAPVTGNAVYNVVPNKAGIYFNKIECFCFTKQTLMPQQDMHFPVSFFLDPELLKDPEMDDVDTITLSYTFFPLKEETR